MLSIYYFYFISILIVEMVHTILINFNSVTILIVFYWIIVGIVLYQVTIVIVFLRSP